MIKNLFLLLLICFVNTAQGKSNPEPKICLVIEVLNDESVIEKCLKSAAEIVDYLLIYDLGSSDQTISKIQDFSREFLIPYEVIPGKKQFKNSQEALKNREFDLSKTFLLEARPDALLKISKDFSKNQLKNDGYLLVEPSVDFTYMKSKRNLLRSSIQWDQIEPYIYEPINGLSWVENSDVEYKKQRMQERINDLLVVCQDDPNNATALLEIAGAYKFSADYDAAANYYLKCAQLEGNNNETWLAKYLLGECLEELGDMKTALYWYLEAYRMSPSRVDPLTKLSIYHFFPPSHSETKRQHLITLD